MAGSPMLYAVAAMAGQPSCKRPPWLLPSNKSKLVGSLDGAWKGHATVREQFVTPNGPSDRRLLPLWGRAWLLAAEGR